MFQKKKKLVVQWKDYTQIKMSSMHRQRLCKYSHCPKRETKDPRRVCEWKPKKTYTHAKLHTCSVSSQDHQWCQWGWGPAERTLKQEGWRLLCRWFGPAQTEYLIATTKHDQHPVIHPCCWVCCEVRCTFCSLKSKIETTPSVWQDEEVVKNICCSKCTNITTSSFSFANFWGLPTQGLSLQRPHFLRGRSQEALQAFNNWREVGHQQLLGSVGW